MTAEERAEEVWDSIAGGMELECTEYDNREANWLIAAAITAAVEEREKELIPLVCYVCDQGQMPHRGSSREWLHRFEGWDYPKCAATVLYESIYQRGPAAAAGDDAP